MTSPIRIEQIEPTGALDVLGHALAPQPHGAADTYYLVPGAPIARAIEDVDGRLSAVTAPPPPGFSPTWAPAALLDFIEDGRQRYAIGELIESERNESAVLALPKVALPARAPMAAICVARRVMKDEVIRELVVDWAIPIERAAQLAPMRVSGTCHFEFAELLAMGHELVQDPRGCTAAWGHRSDALDAEERDRSEAEERAREDAEEAARRFDEINDETCDELGVFVVTHKPNEPHLAFLTGEPSNYQRDEHPELLPFTDAAGSTYFIFASARLAGLRIGHERVLEGDDVPQIPRRYFKNKSPVTSRAMAVILHELRAGTFDDAPVTAFRDGRTADGRLTAERLVERWKTIADVLCGNEANTWNELFIQAWIRSSLPLDGGYAAYIEVIADEWKRTHPAPSNRVLEPARTTYVDESGRAWSDFDVQQLIEAGQILAMNGAFFFAGNEKPFVRKELPAVMWKAPPYPMSEATYRDTALKAMMGGRHAVVGLNELVEELEPGLLNKIAARLLGDPWRPVIEKFIEGKPHVSVGELEEALREAGEISGVFPMKGFGRIRKILEKLGWENTQIPIAGRRKWAWIPARGES